MNLIHAMLLILQTSLGWILYAVLLALALWGADWAGWRLWRATGRVVSDDGGEA